MSKLYVAHRTQVGPNRMRHTIHFTRTQMLADYAKAMRETAKQLPSKRIAVYEGEDVVIIERDIA